MTSVPILVFEDAPLADSKELRELVKFSSGKVYVFDWHDTYNALGGIGYKEPLVIRSIQAYRNAVSFLRNELSGDAIIFMDLELMEPDKPFNLGEEDISEELLNLAACYDARVISKADLLEHFNPKRLGLLLALTAAQNLKWRGMILFASQRADVDLKTVEQCVSTRDRVLWRDVGRSMSVGSTAQVRAGLIDQAIQEFLQWPTGPSFWPERTEGWFNDNPGQPPHNPPAADTDPQTFEDIRWYLGQLLPGFAVPELWFQNPHWKRLYETLKSLIGSHSVAGGSSIPKPKNLKLAGIPLLLAAQMAWRKTDIEWFKSFVWEPEDRKSVGILEEVMNHKTRADAQQAIRVMAFFLAHLGLSSDSSDSQVIGAMWGEVPQDPAKHLWIDFKLDPLNRASGRSLLQTVFGSRWGNGSGQTVGAYEKMMQCACVPGAPPTPPNFSLCIYPVDNGKGQAMTRLDFRAIS